ncbi:hypothetical protein BB561_000754 [Smittium simulii]|uniref:Protein EFR3 n=1 Tax=Smittium simulii TaxID=133385 RepID=A0A2T9YXN7_9FUNG|nr:hypothetical protein BB561_000754 [Smittium simulii]
MIPQESHPNNTTDNYSISFESSFSNYFIIQSTFRRYIKHANIIEKCFPVLKTDEPVPLPNALSYLTYYTKSKPVKLAKVGKYLYNRLLSDLSGGKKRDILVEIQIFKAVLESNSRDIYFFGENLLLSVIAILKSGDLDLIFEAADLICLFCMYHNGATSVISPEFRSEYNYVISSFIKFLSTISDTKNILHHQVMGFKVMYAVLSCEDTYSNENTDEKNSIVSALFSFFWVLFTNNSLPQLSKLKFSYIAENSNLVHTLVQNSIWCVLKTVIDSSFSTNLRWVVDAIFHFMGNASDSWNHPIFPSNLLTFIFSQVSTNYQNIIVSETLLYVEKSFHNQLDFSLPQSASSNKGNIQFNDSSINSRSLNTKDLQDLTNVKQQNHNIYKSEPSIEKQRTIQYCLVIVLGNLTNYTVSYTTVPILEVLSKLTICLISIAKYDECFEIDLSYNFSPFFLEDSTEENSPLINESTTKKLLDAIVKTIGSLSKFQNYSTLAADDISFVTSNIDEDFLLNHRLDFSSNDEIDVNFKVLKSKNSFLDQIKELQAQPSYNQVIWLLKVIRELLASFIFYFSKHMDSISSETDLKDQSSNNIVLTSLFFSWSSLKVCVICLQCVDPQIRLLAGQTLILALQNTKNIYFNCKGQLVKNGSISRKKSIKIILPELEKSMKTPLSISSLNLAGQKFDNNLFSQKNKNSNAIKIQVSNAETDDIEFYPQISPSSTNQSATSFDKYSKRSIDDIFADSAFSLTIREILILLVTPVTTNSYCSYLIANSFLKNFIEKNFLSSQFFVIKVVSEVYSLLLSILATLGPFLQQDDSLSLTLSFDSSTGNSRNIEASTTFENESKAFMQNLCLVSTIFGHCLRLVAEENSRQDGDNDLMTYVLSVIKDQKEHDFWCSEMDLDIFSPLMSWLTNEKPFSANIDIGTTWDIEKVIKLIERGEALDYEQSKLQSSFVFDEFITTLNKQLHINYPDIFSKIKYQEKSTIRNLMYNVNNSISTDKDVYYDASKEFEGEELFSIHSKSFFSTDNQDDKAEVKITGSEIAKIMNFGENEQIQAVKVINEQENNLSFISENFKNEHMKSKQILKQAMELGLGAIDVANISQTNANTVGANDLKFALNDGFANIDMGLLAGHNGYNSDGNNALEAQSSMRDLDTDSEREVNLLTDTEDEGIMEYAKNNFSSSSKLQDLIFNKKNSISSGWSTQLENTNDTQAQAEIQALFDLLKI